MNGVSLGGFITTAHPAAKAGATFRVIIAAGKFHGVIIPQTPTGSLKVRTVFPAKEDGITSPYERGASSENQFTNDAAYLTSPCASANVFPFSRERIKATVFELQLVRTERIATGRKPGAAQQLHSGGLIPRTYDRRNFEVSTHTKLSGEPLAPLQWWTTRIAPAPPQH